MRGSNNFTSDLQLESRMETLEGLFNYLDSLDTVDSRKKPAKTSKENSSDGNILQKARQVLKAISVCEFKANSRLRKMARDLIKDIFLLETYVEEKHQYDKAIGLDTGSA